MTTVWVLEGMWSKAQARVEEVPTLEVVLQVLHHFVF